MDIALCVMVKNEERTLPRLIRSVAGFANKIIALDTGSTDSTVKFLKESGAEVLESPFRNFGESRTELMQFAKGKAEWLLLMDADQELEFAKDDADCATCLSTREDLLEKLKRDVEQDIVIGYSVKHAGDLEYWVPRLLRGYRDWHFVGATHEYLDTCSTCHPKLHEISIVHHSDGGSRSDKSLRDIRLLTQELRREPANARSMFYLANTFRDVGQRTKAYEMFQKYLAHSTWEEEAFIARLESAKITLDPLDMWQCWAQRPGRAEPLGLLEQVYRGRGEKALAFAVEDMRRKIKTPPVEDILFVEKWAYKDQPLVALQPWEMIPGWWNADESEFYRRLTKGIPDGGSFVEIGSWLGRSFACFDYWRKQNGKSIAMTAVDTFKGTDSEPNEAHWASAFPHGTADEFKANMARCGLNGYQMLKTTSVEAASLTPDHSVNAVFIDGDHSTPAVRTDVNAWYPKVVPGGFLCGHDFDRESVVAGVTALFKPERIRTHGRCWIIQCP
jgi:hypothetical protein